MTVKKKPTATSGPTPAAGWWDTWFWRIIQIVGAATFVEQVIVGQHLRHDRPWILLFAASMTLGAEGCRVGIRALSRILGGHE